MSKRILVHAALIAVIGLASVVARAADDPREVKGRALFAKGDYREALDIYATLFAEQNDPLYLRNIGRCYQKLHEPDRAIDAFQEYLRRSPHVKESERAEVDGFIKEMESLRQRENAAHAQPSSPGEGLPPVRPANAHPEPPRVAATSTSAAAPLAPLPVPAAPPGTDLTSSAAVPAPAEPTSLTHQWWFWTGVGAVVAGAVITALVLGNKSEKPGCPMGYTCP